MTLPAALEFDRVHPGDCLAHLPRLPDGSVDLAFADPPFNIGYAYDVYEDRHDPRRYLDWTRLWGAEVVRRAQARRHLLARHRDEYAAELKLIFQNDLGLVWPQLGHLVLHVRRSLHEEVQPQPRTPFLFRQRCSAFTFNADPVRVPSARQLVYADARADGRGACRRYLDLAAAGSPRQLPGGGGHLVFPARLRPFKERAGWHGCQMPEQLLGRILRACSNPGEVVLDPFGGSGTNPGSGKKLQRRWLGFELSEAYAARIEERLAKIARAMLLTVPRRRCTAPRRPLQETATPSTAKAPDNEPEA